MFDFVSKLLMARALKLEKGEIYAYNIPLLMNPLNCSVELINNLIKKHGYAEAHDLIYKSYKDGNVDFCKALRKNVKHNTGFELAKLYAQGVTMGGYGVAKITKFDPNEKLVICRFYNSPVAREYVKQHGKSPYPIDIMTNGLYAGSFSVLFNNPGESIETTCIAKGDSYCEFVFGTPKKISELRDTLWGRLGVSK